MKYITVLSNTRDCSIELTHHTSDPGAWIVRHWKKYRWFKKRISSDWFTNESQARTFADKIQREHQENISLPGLKEKPTNAE